MDEYRIALQVTDKDNVATVFANGVADGEVLELRTKAGDRSMITVIGDVPYGHKIAVCAIAAGEQIIKYGEEIGVASKDIQKGEYVHVHNMDSMRGRGDLAGKER